MKNMTKKKKSLINKKKIWLRDKKYKTVKYRKNNILIVINNKNNINFPKIIVQIRYQLNMKTIKIIIKLIVKKNNKS